MKKKSKKQIRTLRMEARIRKQNKLRKRGKG